MDIEKAKLELRQMIIDHLTDIGFRQLEDGKWEVIGEGKEVIRSVYSTKRRERLDDNAPFIARHFDRFKPCFAEGKDINPERIRPRLQRVTPGSEEGQLLQLATLSWSVPVSGGYGRKLRYLVWDDSNGKLIGVINLSDGPIMLKHRDRVIGWNKDQQMERLVNTMDASVLGAVPPYNILLGGKLTTCLIRTQEVFDDFRSLYKTAGGTFSRQVRPVIGLLAVTTSSSMGRSSIYNRLKLDGRWYFRPVGYTAGFGTFHISRQICNLMEKILNASGIAVKGHRLLSITANNKMLFVLEGLRTAGIPDSVLKHGIKREVFYCQMAENSEEILRTGEGTPDTSTLKTVEQVGQLALDRWVRPRAKRVTRWKDWTIEDLKKSFLVSYHPEGKDAATWKDIEKDYYDLPLFKEAR